MQGLHPVAHRGHHALDLVVLAFGEGQAQVVAMVERVARHLANREERIAFSRPSQMQQGMRQGARGGFRVRIGLIPEYSSEGQGVLLSGVVPGSPAEKAGLRAGDRVITVMGTRVQSMEELTQLYERMEAGKPVEFTILREGKELKVEIVPTSVE